MFEILKNLKSFQLLLVIIFISCTVPDDSSVQDTKTTTVAPSTTTTTVAITVPNPPTNVSVNYAGKDVQFLWEYEAGDVDVQVFYVSYSYDNENWTRVVIDDITARTFTLDKSFTQTGTFYFEVGSCGDLENDLTCSIGDSSYFETTGYVSPTTTTTVAPSTTTTTLAPSTNYQDKRDVRLFRASTISDEHINILMKYVKYAERSFFDDPRVKVDNLYPILIAQLDRNNYQSAIDLEGEFCQYLMDSEPDSHRQYCYYRGVQADGSIGLFTYGGRPSSSSISGQPEGDSCCWLFINESHDLPQHASAMGYVTLHEMLHIFQISNYLDIANDREEKMRFSGKIVGDDNKEHPFWIEGHATYYSYRYYAKSIGDISWLKREMANGLFECYCSDGKARIIDRYLNGPKLYDVTWDSDWAVGYQVGAWFVAYIESIHGEEKIQDFWFNTQTGKLFPENFKDTFGKDYKTYVDEFESFIRNNDRSAILAILPSDA